MLCSLDVSTIAGPTSENKHMDVLQSSMALIMEAIANTMKLTDRRKQY